jgi:hypothetical protein
MWEFTEDEKLLITSLVDKGRKEHWRNEKFAIIDFKNFYALFTPDEAAILKKWLALNPERLGYQLPYLGAKDNARDIVPIANQTFREDGQTHTIPCQYLPRNVYEAYQQLNEALYSDLGKKLLVLFGYRSPARQVFIFFDVLEGIYNFDFNKTIKRVCFPDYSEHVCTQRQAIDFQTQEGLASDEFDTTEEYAWLKKNGGRFGFYESYPQNNTVGMMYEPWHWHFEART